MSERDANANPVRLTFGYTPDGELVLLNQDQYAFLRALTERLRQGAAEYGDRSFARPAPELLSELAEEALDLAGWGFVLWSRIKRIQAAPCAQEERDQ